MASCASKAVPRGGPRNFLGLEERSLGLHLGRVAPLRWWKLLWFDAQKFLWLDPLGVSDKNCGIVVRRMQAVD